MPRACPTQALGALCDALGLQRVTELFIGAQVGSVVTVTATMVVEDDQLDRVTEVVKRYRLEPAEITEPE